MPVSGRVFQPNLVPVSFSSLRFVYEDITLQYSSQDGIVGTVSIYFQTFKTFGYKKVKDSEYR